MAGLSGERLARVAVEDGVIADEDEPRLRAKAGDLIDSELALELLTARGVSPDRARAVCERAAARGSTGRLVKKRTDAAATAPTELLDASRFAPPVPGVGAPRLLGDDAASRFPRSLHCDVCERLTTHVRQGCTRCMGRADNRKQGALWAAIGAVLIAIGLGLMAVRTSSSTGFGRRRVGVSWLSILALVGGASLAAKGLKGLVFGSDPEAM
jgi:hypothetical protein